MTQGEIDYFAELDRRNREETRARGRQCNWRFNSKEEAERIANDAWYLEECNMMMLEGRRVLIQNPYGRSQLSVVQEGNQYCIVIFVGGRSVLPGQYPSRNLLGIPLVFQ